MSKMARTLEEFPYPYKEANNAIQCPIPRTLR
jgi:hypothetical protein